MSASSPTTAAIQAHKRPLEDSSSPTAPTDQPDAKRPARNKSKQNEPAPTSAGSDGPEPIDPPTTNSDNDDHVDTEKEQNGADAQVSELPGAPSAKLPAASTRVLETQPIQSVEASSAQDYANAHHDESQWLHLRSVITSAEAATIIGKGGENVNSIRRLSGAKCTISEYVRGAVERILTVSGLVDAVAKAFGLIVRTLNDESLDNPSTAESKTYPLRLLIPHILIGRIIGKAGSRIREIQEASGSRLNASEQCLPLSSERSLVVLGVADAVHIAVYYIGSTLVEQLTDRYGGPVASAYAARGGGLSSVVGGMQIVPYTPHHAGGQWGAGDHLRRQVPSNRGMPPQYPMGFGPPGPMHHAQPPIHMGAGSPRPAAGYMGAGPHAHAPYGAQPPQPQPQPHVGSYGPPQPPQPAQGVPMGGQAITQQIFIPNDMVGAIIGKGGSKINEIRQLSGSVIKINEPQDNSPERLVSITGTQEANQMALYMLYNKLGSVNPGQK